MTRTLAIKVTPQGVLVPRPLIAAWGDVEEVHIEQYADTIVIKSKANHPPPPTCSDCARDESGGLDRGLALDTTSGGLLRGARAPGR